MLDFGGQIFRGQFLSNFLDNILGQFLANYLQEMRYHFTNFYYSFPIAKESARVNGAISSVFLGVCRTKRLSNAQTTHFFTRSWEPSKNSYLTILIYMTQKKEKKSGKKASLYSGQILCNEVLRWTLFMKENLRFGLVCAG